MKSTRDERFESEFGSVIRSLNETSNVSSLSSDLDLKKDSGIAERLL